VDPLENECAIIDRHMTEDAKVTFLAGFFLGREDSICTSYSGRSVSHLDSTTCSHDRFTLVLLVPSGHMPR
jgi:hypothetical protein